MRHQPVTKQTTHDSLIRLSDQNRRHNAFSIFCSHLVVVCSALERLAHSTEEEALSDACWALNFLSF